MIASVLKKIETSKENKTTLFCCCCFFSSFLLLMRSTKRFAHFLQQLLLLVKQENNGTGEGTSVRLSPRLTETCSASPPRVFGSYVCHVKIEAVAVCQSPQLGSFGSNRLGISSTRPTQSCDTPVSTAVRGTGCTKPLGSSASTVCRMGL